MEYFSSIQNDVEKEEGELSSDDDDDDNRGNVLESSNSAHPVGVKTKKQVMFYLDQTNNAETSQIIVIDEWNESAASNERKKHSISHKRNQSYDTIERNQSSARGKNYTSDSKYTTTREAPEDENRSSCQRSPRRLKRSYSAADDQSQPLPKYDKPTSPECSAFNKGYVSVECSSRYSGDLRDLIGRRVHESSSLAETFERSYSSFKALSEHVETCNDVSNGSRSRLSKHRSVGSRVESNSRSRVSVTNYPKENRKELIRNECLTVDESNKSKQRLSRYRTTRNCILHPIHYY